MSVKRILVPALAALLALSLFALPGCGMTDDGESTSSNSQSANNGGDQTAVTPEPDEPDVPQVTEPAPTEEPVRITRSAPLAFTDDYFYYITDENTLYFQKLWSDDAEPVRVTDNVASFLPYTSSYGSDGGLIIKNDGTLYALTKMDREQQSDGTYAVAEEPKYLLDDVVRTEMQYNSEFALKSDGTLLGWGLNDGMLGTGTSETFTKSPTEIIRNVADFWNGPLGNSYALLKDGSLWVWGAGAYGMSGAGIETGKISSPQYLMEGVVSLSFSSTSVYALKSDGSVWAWGNNTNGKIGNGTTETVLSPVHIIDDVKEVNVISTDADALVYVIKNDDSLWGWGKTGYYGTMGFDSDEASPTPRLILEGVKKIVANAEMTLALKTDGTLVGWGYNSFVGYRQEPVTLSNNVGSYFCDNEDDVAIITPEGELLIWGLFYLGNLNKEAPYSVMSGVRTVVFTSSRLWIFCEDGSFWKLDRVHNTGDSPNAPVKICDNIRLD